MALASVSLIGCLGKLWLWLQEQWSCDGGLCSSCHYRDQLVSRNTWQREHGLYASVSGCPSQMSQIAVPRSLSVKSVHTVTMNALLLCCFWRRMQKPQSIFYLPSRIWCFFHFVFVCFLFTWNAHLLGRKIVARKVMKYSFFYMVLLYIVDNTGDGYLSRKWWTAGSSVSPTLRLTLYTYHLEGGSLLCLV